MPDTSAITDDVLESIIQSEKAFQAVTTHARRFVRTISFRLDLTNKLGDNDAQMTLFLEKLLPEAQKDQTNLETACAKVQ